MSYASDLGIHIGSKIKVIKMDKFGGCFEEGDIIELVKDDHSICPWFQKVGGRIDHSPFSLDTHKWGHYKEEEKDMTFELKAGDKVEIINTGIFREDMVRVGDIATYDGYYLSCPTWNATQYCPKSLWAKYLKPYVEAKPKTPFEEAGYTKDTVLKVVSRKGEVQHNFDIGTEVKLNHDDGSASPDFVNISGDTTQYVSLVDLEAVEVKELKFPCCVPLSEIKDQVTFDKIFAFFVTSGARAYETDYEDALEYEYNYFGADYDKDTIFYNNIESYSFNDEEDDVTIYSLADLLAMLPKEEQAVVEPAVPVLLPVGTEVKIAETSEYYRYGNDGNPINIKGVITANNRSSDHAYRVNWDNGRSNVYKLEDLVLWNEGWIEWNGGECPVETGTVIDVKYRGGDITIGISANMHNLQDGFYDAPPETNENLATNWDIDDEDEDIVAYRLHKPSVASQETVTDVSESKPSTSCYSINLGKSDVEAPTEPTYPKLGDKIKIIGNEGGHHFSVGEEVIVTEDCSDEHEPNWGCSREGWSQRGGCYVYVGEFEIVPANTESQPLVTIVKDVTYTVTIKGIQVILTQDELNELSIELDGFEDYE